MWNIHIFCVFSENVSLASSIRFPDDSARLRGLAIFKVQTVQRLVQYQARWLQGTAN